MTKLINDDKLKHQLNWMYSHGEVSIEGIYKAIDEMPAEDAEPARHGHWIRIHADPLGCTDSFRCSECRSYIRLDSPINNPGYHFCPICGAIMDGEVE